MRTKKLKRRSAAIVAVAMAGALAVAGIAVGAGNSTVTVEFKPKDLPKSTFKKGELHVITTSTYTSGTQTDKARLNFDDDFKVNTSAVGKCTSAQLQDTTQAQALAACGGKRVGKGAARATLASFQDTKACVNVFNARDTNPNATGDQPGVFLHTRATPGSLSITCGNNSQGSVTIVLAGILSNTSSGLGLGGDYNGGKQVLFKNIVATAGLPLNRFDVRVGPPAVSTARNFVSARCADGDKKLGLKTKFFYVSPTSSQLKTDTWGCL